MARGAHGEVWRAVRTDDARQKQLILKRLHAGSAGMLAGLRERHFGERLRGTPHVARFEDAFEHGGSLWLVFVDEGFSLHDLLYTSSREAGGAVVVQPSPFWLQLRQGRAGNAVMRHILRQSFDGLARAHAVPRHAAPRRPATPPLIASPRRVCPVCGVRGVACGGKARHSSPYLHPRPPPHPISLLAAPSRPPSPTPSPRPLAPPPSHPPLPPLLTARGRTHTTPRRWSHLADSDLSGAPDHAHDGATAAPSRL